MSTLYTTADDRTAGADCPACEAALHANDELAICPACGRPHHRDCWDRTGGCSAYACAPANRSQRAGKGAGGGGVSGGTGPGIVITLEQIESAAPLQARPTFHGARVATPEEIEAATRPKFSRGAIAAAVCAVAGIPLFGLLTGPVAVVIGAISLGGISAGRRRGVWVASLAIILGLADFVGWALVVSHYMSRHEMPGMIPADFHVSEADLRNAPPIIAASLRANVLITRTGPMGGALGSGVVISIKDGSALILTNRHVASPDTTDQGAQVGVQFVDGRTATGTVVWNGPEGLDASLVRVAANPSAVAATVNLDAAPKIGDDVFAVGNPRGLGWTHTKGSVSQFRERDAGGSGGSSAALRIIQTSAPINPGNSGGGLYAAAGNLIGINTYSTDKRESEGLGFAISIESIRAAIPSWAAEELHSAPPPPPPSPGKPRDADKPGADHR